MDDQEQGISIPPVVAQEIGMLHLQVSMLQQEIAQLRAALAAMAKEKEPESDKES